MSERKNQYETFRLKYKLRHYEEFKELKSNVSIRDIVNLAVSECFDVDIRKGLFYENNPKMFSDFVYFFIVRYFILEKGEKYNSLNQIIDESYDRNSFELKYSKKENTEIINKDTYRKRIKGIIKELFLNNDAMSQYYNAKGNVDYRYKRYKISEWYKNEISIYLEEYNDETFCNFRAGKFRNITFEKYDKLVKKIKDKIANLDDGYQNIRLYNLEIVFKFELIKYISKVISGKNKKLYEQFKVNDKPVSEQDKKKFHYMKKEIARELLMVRKIPDFYIRYLYIETYKELGTDDEIIGWEENICYWTQQVNSLAVIYSLYLIENTYENKEVIYELIEEDRDFIEKIYTISNNEDITMSYYSNSEINKDFTEDDFMIVMQALEESYYGIEDKYKFKKRYSYKVAQGVNSNLTISEISENVHIHENVVEKLVKQYIEWLDTLDANIIINEIKEFYKGELKSEGEECEIANKMIQYPDTNSIVRIAKLYKKHEKIIEIFIAIYRNCCYKAVSMDFIVKIIMEKYKSELRMEIEEEVSRKIIRDSNLGLTKEEVISLKINDEFRRAPDMSISELANKYKIDTDTVKKYMFKEIIWLKMRADALKYPDISISELAEKYKVNRRTAKKYISSEKIPCYSQRRQMPSKLDNYKSKINQLLSCGYNSSEIYGIIKKEGFTGKIGIIKKYIKSRNNKNAK